MTKDLNNNIIRQMPKKQKEKELTLRISLDEYEALREQAKVNDKVITDPDIIATIDKIEELVTTLRKRIVRKDIYDA
mgnify:FL=1